ncbi:MAG: CDGSH iron-sulfur domain-containing protein [Desulfitobacteriaceae bacterium]
MSNKSTPKIKIVRGGPYLVSGNIPMTDQTIIANEKGRSIKWEAGDSYSEKEAYALCRCGHSSNSPYCDGSHQKNQFEGTETASRQKYLEQAQTLEGSDLVLTDANDLCAYARFCHRQEGDVWELTEHSDEPKLRDSAIQAAADCPAGRLITWDKKTGKAIEPKFEPSIGIIEDPPQKVSGPIWVRGGIPIEASDGTEYEVRNMVTLCRCGKSQNKPFCDAAHVSIRYTANKE